jgi:hypothetical protein
MRTIPCVAVLLVAALAGSARADGLRHELSATSNAVIEIAPDGTVVTRASNVRLVPYALFDGNHQLPRLATVTSDVRRRTDAEGDDPASTVSVTVDDLSAAAPRRLATFSDPGSEGVLLGEAYFDTRQPGCCAGPTLHSVRALETGRLLYRATGDAAGSAAWAGIPNARPALIRWAAFDGRVDEAAQKRGVIGTLAYGSPEATLSRLELRVTGNAAKAPKAEDLNLGLSHEARLLWVDKASQKAGYPPSAGSPEDPAQIWSLDGVGAPQKIGGFALRLLDFDGRALATIPVAADRLAAARATLAPGIALDEARP